MKKTRVVIGIPCLMLGGSELATLSLARALVGGGYDVTVCCYYEHDAAMRNALRRPGRGVARSVAGSRASVPTLVTYSGLNSRMWSTCISPQAWSILAARAGVSVSATVHAAGQKGCGWKAIALRFAARFTDHFFCVSQSRMPGWVHIACGREGLPGAGLTQHDLQRCRRARTCRRPERSASVSEIPPKPG